MQEETIRSELARLEQAHDIHILYAVESGSRAWGFASTDSDWDVRFLYVHPVDWYLAIDEKRDNLEDMRPGKIDLAGWELRKALRLFRKSNPPLLEWLHSPIVYAEPFSTAQQMWQLMARYFNPKSCLYHYLHMAGGNYRQYLRTEEVRVKKYFYVLRPLLACRWIERNGTMPPMAFETLLNSQVEAGELKAAIDQLLARKRRGEELDVEPRIPVINTFVEQQLDHFNALVKTYGRLAQPDTGRLDQLFRDTLEEVWE